MGNKVNGGSSRNKTTAHLDAEMKRFCVFIVVVTVVGAMFIAYYTEPLVKSICSLFPGTC